MTYLEKIPSELLSFPTTVGFSNLGGGGVGGASRLAKSLEPRGLTVVGPPFFAKYGLFVC